MTEMGLNWKQNRASTELLPIKNGHGKSLGQVINN